MKSFVHFLLVIALVAAASGCSRTGELDSKEEYSTLQYFEAEYRTSENAKPYIAVKDALGSKYDVFGLPQQGKERGYVWFIANPGSQPAVKRMPDDAMFVLSEDTLSSLEKSVRLSPMVREYLKTQVR